MVNLFRPIVTVQPVPLEAMKLNSNITGKERLALYSLASRQRMFQLMFCYFCHCALGGCVYIVYILNPQDVRGLLTGAQFILEGTNCSECHHVSFVLTG